MWIIGLLCVTKKRTCSLPSYVSDCLPTSTCSVDKVFVDLLLPIDMPYLHNINALDVLLVLIIIVTDIFKILHMDAPYISPFFYRKKLQHTIYGFFLFFYRCCVQTFCPPCSFSYIFLFRRQPIIFGNPPHLSLFIQTLKPYTSFPYLIPKRSLDNKKMHVCFLTILGYFTNIRC